MRFGMADGTVVDTEKAAASWKEARDWDGRNMISRATGSPFTRETLYKSRRGRYYIVFTSNWEGQLSSARWITEKEAARWLLVMGHSLPEDLADLAEEIEE
jgi:hypothetical protein